MERRIVLEHSDGSLAGVCQILGRESELSTMFNPQNLPAVVNLRFNDRRSDCHLVRVTDHYVLYREANVS